MKKNKKIVIAIIVVAVLILVVGIALAVVLKNNNKEEFFKYVAQIFDSENGFIDKRIENYNEKKASNTFENIGKMTFNVPTEGMDTKTANEINNTFNISFMGNFDNENQKAEELVKINYDNENNFPILYKKVGNIQAVKLSPIVKKYLAVKDLDIMGMLNMGGSSSLSTGSSAATNGSSATKAADAKKRADLGAGKDAVAIDTQTILLDLYSSGNTQPSAEDIADKFLSHQYNSDYATITTKKEMTEDSVGTINIVSNEDKTYAIIGTVSKTGKIDWKEEFGTYNTEETELAENVDKAENTDKVDLKKRIADYLQSIKPMIDEKDITKVSSSDSSGFSLEISNEKLIQIIGIILDKMSYEDKLISDDALSYYKLSFSNIIPEDGKVIVTIYQNDEKTNRICIEVSDHFKMDVKKLVQNDELSYDISLTLSQTNNNILAKAVVGFTGLDSLETVNENYNIGIDMNGYSYTYNIENEVNFTDVEIKDFADKEFTDINKLSQANQAKLLQAIMDRFNKINNELMKKAKINPDNFWNNLIPKYYAPKRDADEFDYSLDLEDEDKDEENEEDDEDEASQTGDTIDSTKKTATDSNSTSTDNDSDENLAKSFSETEKNVFNSKYEKYKGDEVEGSKVKQLIMSIIANNMADEERQIKVTGDVTLTGNEVPESVETSKTYSVEFKKSKDGYVNEAVIKVNE